MSDERWVEVAMTDTFMVADVLIRLGQADPLPPQPITTTKPLLFHWNVRQRRSRGPLKNSGKNDGGESTTRASPTTPLSWSGGTSFSGGGDESTSRPSTSTARPFKDARSKGIISSEITTTTKRSRKKKTLPQLREVESSLLKERRYLRTELMNLRITVEKHRAANDSLKRMKLDVQSKQCVRAIIVSEEAISNEVRKMEESCVCPPTNLPAGGACNNLIMQRTSTSDCPNKLQEARNREEAHCSLPDLNIPIVEPDSEVLYGTS